MRGDLSLARQAPEVAVGGYVVETMVMDPNVRDMRGHQLNGLVAADLQESLLPGGVILQQRRAELETLGPFSPAPAGVPAFGRENGRPLARRPALFEIEDFAGGDLE